MQHLYWTNDIWRFPEAIGYPTVPTSCSFISNSCQVWPCALLTRQASRSDQPCPSRKLPLSWKRKSSFSEKRRTHQARCLRSDSQCSFLNRDIMHCQKFIEIITTPISRSMCLLSRQRRLLLSAMSSTGPITCVAWLELLASWDKTCWYLNGFYLFGVLMLIPCL